MPFCAGGAGKSRSLRVRPFALTSDLEKTQGEQDAHGHHPLLLLSFQGSAQIRMRFLALVVSGSGSNQLKPKRQLWRGAAWAAVVLPVVSAELSRGAWGRGWQRAALAPREHPV